ncbi:hypothetical protein JRO89_XS11G0164300 [Xanthoceras sorbifolium]|uniref:FK506-binding protein n=1 Tax=Xanthoceras sorbifolium TaxID=99658 RepID=A0ABQ8HFT8_9ROSI|nr:hypothetical protein JRO89_XS11G0164300 [Xanthoceras sorbifolium]
MGFWGVEVKPEKPHPYHSDNVEGKLHVTQATLGLGSSTEKSILQCSIGDRNPIFLCSLLPNKNESCSLNLEFDEDDLVAFSVIGPRSIHLSGYFEADGGGHLRDEYDSDSYGEDIADTETDESSEFDTEDEYDDDFIHDDDDMFPTSPVPNSGVVIEEIVDDEKPSNGNGQSKRLKKKGKSSDSEQQIVVKSDTNVPVLESEDEDGFPISTSHKSDGPQVEAEKEISKRANEDTEKKKAKDSSDNGASKKRKVKTADQDDQAERDIDNGASSVPSENQSEKKKKKKKKKKAQESEGQKKEGQTASAMGDKNDSALSSEEMQSSAKSSKVRTFPNGLVIEEVAMGKPDGKRASPGKQVSVHYIGKLKKNGKIFDSNVGRAPFKFRLGIGQVIKGWDVGVNGMRVGDKRRLTIPPLMGYGAKGAGGQIPPNAWLVFDVELVDVR